MVEVSAPDVLRNQEHATPTIAPETANGHRLDHGLNVLKNVREVHKTELVLSNRRHLMAEWTALENQPNLGTAMKSPVLLTANGVNGANGTNVQRNVEEECTAELERL